LAVAGIAFQLGDYALSIAEAREAERIQPGLPLSASFEARALALSGQGTECLDLELGVYELVRALCEHTSGLEAQAAQRVDAALAALTSGDAGDISDHLEDVALQDLASYYGLVDDAPNATRWLRAAFSVSPIGVEARILASELFDTVRDDPDFAAAVVDVRRAALIRIEAERERLSAAGN